MFSPNHPENVTQQVSLTLSSKPPSKIDDTSKRIGLSTKSPGVRISEVIDERRAWEVLLPIFYFIFKVNNTIKNTWSGDPIQVYHGLLLCCVDFMSPRIFFLLSWDINVWKCCRYSYIFACSMFIYPYLDGKMMADLEKGTQVFAPCF